MEEDKEVVFEDVNMSDDDDDDGDSSDNESDNENGPVYLPGKTLNEGEELVCDESAYIMLHQAQSGAPCLSFDVCINKNDPIQQKYPMTANIVAGTQAAKSHVNNLIVMRMANLTRTSKDDNDSEVDSDYSDDEDVAPDGEKGKPTMSCVLIPHQGCINRVRTTMVGSNQIVATWSELGRVNIWNVTEYLEKLQNLPTTSNGIENVEAKPIYAFNGHQQEGFAMDWSQTTEGVLATGDCKKNIHIWHPNESATAGWKVDERPLIGHTDSVEDLQWSPNEFNVLASCSVDKSIRIWDCRASPSNACMLTCAAAHESDVNVINWNRMEPLIASGGDDGVVHIWDLRQFGPNKAAIATFKHHTKPVTTIEWHPTDSTVFASGGADDQIVLWDLAVEKDDTELNTATAAAAATTDISNELNHLPPQLLFIHQGQSEIKELHWHPKMPGTIISTAQSGYNVFKTISV